MNNKRYRPLIDKLFWIIWIPTLALLAGVTVIGFFEISALFIMIFVDAFTLFFLISPLFGYVELRENSLFIKYGFILKKEIPYSKIRGIEKERRFYSESMLTLKNSFEHINIKYNRFDVTAVSVKSNDDFINELKSRL